MISLRCYTKMTYLVNAQNDFSVGKVGDTFTIHFQYLIINQKASLGGWRVYETSSFAVRTLFKHRDRRQYM